MLMKRSTRALHEGWLAFNRLLTVMSLQRAVRRPARSPAGYDPVPGSLLYVAASSLPYHISGYTTRTHEVICALGSVGVKVKVLTRLGYPWDRKDRVWDAAGETTLIDDVLYMHEREPSAVRWPVLQFALKGASVIAKVAARERVAVIHAASNHVNALPALLAAHQLGIPFHYEMRGLWELTRISRMPDFRDSQGYKQGLALEGLVASHADRLFVISEQLANYARQNWGVSSERMALLPNCVDPQRFQSADPLGIEPTTIGYAGSLINYEGLDTLVDAVDLLTKRGFNVRVNIVGDGEVRKSLEEQVQRLELTDRIRFLGKVAPESARDILARCTLVCIPRKPFKVCEIVPPIKMVEAMAMGKPVIVPDLPVFRDELGEGCGWFFTAGDPVSLAETIESALRDRALLAITGAKARQYAVSRRNWQMYVQEIADTILAARWRAP